MSRHYILKGKFPQRATLMEWAEWMDENNGSTHVAHDMFGLILISTIFLGKDHNYLSYNPKFPILFETMIFGGKYDEYQDRYISWDEAEMGHAKAVQLVKASLPNAKTNRNQTSEVATTARAGGFGASGNNQE